jgi:hypothetical protein
MAMKFNQYWDLIPGRKTEYAEFIQQDFLPVMRELGIQVVAGWFVQVGESPHIISEGLARNINHINAVLKSPSFRSMTSRHMQFVRNYSSRVLVASGRLTRNYTKAPPEGYVKFIQAWNIRPGYEATYSELIGAMLVPTLENLGIEVAAEWNVLIGSGPFVILEGHARDLETIARTLADRSYRHLMTKWEDLVEDYRSRILVRHDLFLQAIREVYGAPIRSISENDISSMYGPIVD